MTRTLALASAALLVSCLVWVTLEWITVMAPPASPRVTQSLLRGW